MTSLALIGPGRHGTAIARLFVAHGVDVTLFHRRPEQAEIAAEAVRSHAVGATVDVAPTLTTAVRDHELVILSTVWDGPQRAVIGQLGDALVGKILLDVSNPLDVTPAGAQFRRPAEGSAGQFVAGLLPHGVGQVKAFANVPMAALVAPADGAPAPLLPFAADSETTAARALPYLAQTGWEPRHVGDLANASDLEIGGAWATDRGRWGRPLVEAAR